MPVISEGAIISGAVNAAMSEVKIGIASISKRLDALSDETYDHVDGEGISLFRRGKMVWWTKIKDAGCYTLKLFVGKNEIDIIEINRNKAYHTFTDLIGNNVYKVTLEVENRDGQIINSISINI